MADSDFTDDESEYDSSSAFRAGIMVRKLPILSDRN
jgi:hypothetical protein